MSETTTADPDGRNPVRKRPPSALSAKLKTAFNRFRGVPVETDLAAYARTVRSIRAAHEGGEIAAIADAEIARRAAALRRPPADGASVPPSREDERVRVGRLRPRPRSRPPRDRARRPRRPDRRRPGHGRRPDRRAPDGGGQDAGGGVLRLLLRAPRPARPRPDLQRLPGPPRRGLDGPGLPPPRPVRRRRPGGPGQGRQEGRLRLRYRVCHRQGGRLRLPAGPAGLRARRTRPPAFRRGPRRRGRLHPHRRSPYPARHLRDRRSARPRRLAAGRRRPGPRAGPRLRDGRRERQRLPDRRGHPPRRVRPRLRQPLRAGERDSSWPRSTAPSTPSSCSSATSITSSATAASRSSTSSPAGSWTSGIGPTASRPPSRPRRGCGAAPRGASSARSRSSTSSGSIRRSAA